MTIKESVEKIASAEARLRADQEMLHIEADRILLEYLRKSGAAELADAYERAESNCGGFWHA